MDKPLHTLSLIEAAEGIKNRRFTSEAYTQALLARIASTRRRHPWPGLGSTRRRRSRPPGYQTIICGPTGHPGPSRGFPSG